MRQNIWQGVTKAARKYWAKADVTAVSMPPLAINNEAITGINAAGTALVEIAKINAGNWTELGNSNGLLVDGPTAGFGVQVAITTAGIVTYTAAQFLSGLIKRDPNGSGRSDVTPTAALLVAAIPGCRVGTAFEFTIRNTADAAETITMTQGAGCTISGTATIAQNNSKRWRVEITNVGSGAEAYTLDSLGTFVH